jgi:hypothetical protein
MWQKTYHTIQPTTCSSAWPAPGNCGSSMHGSRCRSSLLCWTPGPRDSCTPRANPVSTCSISRSSTPPPQRASPGAPRPVRPRDRCPGHRRSDDRHYERSGLQAIQRRAGDRRLILLCSPEPSDRDARPFDVSRHISNKRDCLTARAEAMKEHAWNAKRASDTESLGGASTYTQSAT